MFKRSPKRPKPAAYVIAESRAANTGGASVHIRAQSERSRQAVRAKTRILMCAVAFVFVFASLGMRLAYVSFGAIKPTAYLAAVERVDAPRPEIVDRNDTLLATGLPMIALEIAGAEVWDPHETAEQLGRVLPDIDVAELETKLRAGRYVEARADLTPAERQAIFDLGLPGVRFATRIKRFYPQADLAAHVIGHGEPGRGGVMGLERVANDWGARGALRASIDIRVQQILEDELSASLRKFSAKAAWGAVMDVETGELIALASLPDFDPNAPGAAPADFRRNRAVYDRYELGSVFKPLTAAAALEAGVAREGSTYDARGAYRIADRRITDFHGENRILTLSEVVQFSSNIGMARAADDLGAERQKAFLEKLGLFEPAPVELAENRAPELPRQWGPVENATISYGHGISVTPLHLMAAFAVVVNGGVYYKPTFLKVEGDIEERRVFSPETSAVMRRILRRTVTDGTGGSAEAPGYFPIGKTATADKPAYGGYAEDSRIASFIGAIPGFAPRYAILVSFDDPQPLKETYGYATAGWNAAPAFKRIVERAAPLLGVSTVNEAAALAAFVSGDTAPLREARLETPVLERAP